MGEDIELSESISMGLGGMIGSGIFAVLGPVVLVAGELAWFSVLVGGALILCAAFSFARLNNLTDDPESPLMFVGLFTGNSTLAGMTGWTFVFAYVGTSALYAYAFGIYFASIIGVESILGIPLGSLITLLALLIFLVLNILGAQAAGLGEKLIVGVQVLILAVFAFVGLYYGFSQDTIRTGLPQFDVSPLIAAAIAVVGLEGWELLYFDQEEIVNPEDTVKTAVYVAIGAMIVLFAAIAIVTSNLIPPQLIEEHSETILTFVAQSFLGRIGVIAIVFAALLSTGSALNATLFSAARLVKRVVTEDLMPSELTSSADVPLRPLLMLAIPVTLLSVLGSLSAISSFSSLAFLVLFAAVNYIAFTQRDSVLSTAIPGVGTIGSVLGVVALLYHLYTNNFDVFVIVLVLSAAIISTELLYFEHESLAAEAKQAEENVEDAEEKAKEKGEEVKEKAEQKGKDMKDKAEDKGSNS